MPRTSCDPNMSITNVAADAITRSGTGVSGDLMERSDRLMDDLVS